MASSAEIGSLYQTLLGRAPDPGGLKTYGGMNVNAVRSSILGSPEYAKVQQNQAAAPTKFADQSSKELNALMARQTQEQKGLFGQYAQKLQSQEQLPALYQRLNEEQGIPEITGQLQGYKDEIYRVKGLLDRLDENVTSRNLGTYATQALRDRIADSEGNDMRTTLARLGTGMEPLTERLTSAQQQVSTLLPLYSQQQERELKPLEMEIGSLSDRFAREMTGFNSNRELQLTTLMSKIERQQQLSDREWDLAQQLAAEERSFARQKSLASDSLSQYFGNQGNVPKAATPTPVQQLPSLPAGYQMYAPGPGKPVAYVPPILQPGRGSSGDPLNIMGALTKR